MDMEIIPEVDEAIQNLMSTTPMTVENSYRRSSNGSEHKMVFKISWIFQLVLFNLPYFVQFVWGLQTPYDTFHSISSGDNWHLESNKMSEVDQNEPPTDETKKPRHFKFPSHQANMLHLAKMCQDSKQFSDCVIQCDGGEGVRAHRLVLGAASKFLKTVFQEVPSNLQEATIVVPGVKENVVSSLLDFLYTGEMTVARGDTVDLQLLIDTLQIDPQLISITEDGDTSEDEGPEDLSSSRTEPEVVEQPGKSTEPETVEETKAQDQSDENSVPRKRQLEPDNDEQESERVKKSKK